MWQVGSVKPSLCDLQQYGRAGQVVVRQVVVRQVESRENR